MNKENTQRLTENFPKLYGENFRFSCMDGWFNLIYDLSEEITKLDPECQAAQVKEKFGGLRFYIGARPKEIWNLIAKYENESWKICESCGSSENVKRTSGGWVHSFCNNCTEEYYKERKKDINDK